MLDDALWECGNLAPCARFPNRCGHRFWVSIGVAFPQCRGRTPEATALRIRGVLSPAPARGRRSWGILVGRVPPDLGPGGHVVADAASGAGVARRPSSPAFFFSRSR